MATRVVFVTAVVLYATNAQAQDVPAGIVGATCPCGVYVQGNNADDLAAQCQAACGGGTSNGSTKPAPKPKPAPTVTPAQQARLDAAKNVGGAIGTGLVNMFKKFGTDRAARQERERLEQLEAERQKQLRAEEERRKKAEEQAKFNRNRDQLKNDLKDDGANPDELRMKDDDVTKRTGTQSGLRVTALTFTSCYRKEPEKSGCIQLRNNSTKTARLYVDPLPGVQCTAPPGTYCTVPIPIGRHHPKVPSGEGTWNETDLDLTKAGIQLTLFGGK